MSATTFWIALGGGCGAALRFLLDSWLVTRVRTRVPVGTLVINIVGSFVLGVLVGSLGHSSEVTKVLGTGMMGGFTTFSTASVESARLLLDPTAAPRRRLLGVAHAAVMVLGALLAAAIGYSLGGCI